MTFARTVDDSRPATSADAWESPVDSLRQAVTATSPQRVPCLRAAGLVLAEPVTLDRPSPACDVSAMDGYALRDIDASPGTLPVVGEVQAGQPTIPLPAGAAVRIFTGAMVPPEAQGVIPREQVDEQPHTITLPDTLAWQPGQHIRRQGENGRAGQVLCPAGLPITGPMLAAAASVGLSQVNVHRPVRVGLLVTGGEVLTTHDQPRPWQVRDSNGPALVGLLAGLPWLEVLAPVHAPDHPAALREAILQCLAACDALLITGGVSAGDYDFIPATLREIGARIIFHKLPIRPGKPLLGAMSDQGLPILGLPGNPVSVMVTARRFALPILARRAGITHDHEPQCWVDLADTAQAPAKLHWFPLVKLTAQGSAELVPGKGSGDWVSAASSDGFVEIPPGQPAAGRRRFFNWSL